MQDPGQLLSVYKQLEESNLFYIQNAQVRHTELRSGCQCLVALEKVGVADRHNGRRSSTLCSSWMAFTDEEASVLGWAPAVGHFGCLGLRHTDPSCLSACPYNNHACKRGA